MREEQARAVDVGIRAISGATHYTTRGAEMELLLDARRTLEGMLSEGFLPCPECGRRPGVFAMLDDRRGFAFHCWCALCHCPRQERGETLEALKKVWNGEGSE